MSAMFMRPIAVAMFFAAAFAPFRVFCSGDPLAEGFADVPAQNRPWCYWWWLNGHVDRETARADLESMRRLGFGGLLMFDSRGYWEDDDHLRMDRAEIEFGSGQWHDILAYSVREAARLGLEFSINISSSGGKLDGPWDIGGDAPKQLMYKVVHPDPAGNGACFDRPDLPNFRDIALFALCLEKQTALPGGWRKADMSLPAVKARTCRELAGPASGGRTLSWRAPDGEAWVLLRMGYCTMPGRARDVDMLDAGAVERHWRRLMDPLRRRVGDLFGKTLTHVYSVSWEGAFPTWTKSFEDDFAASAGYRLRPYLPCLAGFDVSGAVSASDGPDGCAAVLEDFSRARNETFRNNFYGTMKRLAAAEGLKLFSESGGPWKRTRETFLHASQMRFYAVNDMPQGEFWYREAAVPSPLHGVRGAVAAAHVYGRPRASAEAFTHMMQHWSAVPSGLKRCGDDAFADGINHFVWHTFTCSPRKFGVPGHEYFAGTHINRNVTWHGEAGAFVGYLGRCQWMLQQGFPTADFAVWAGAEPYQGWGRHRECPYSGSKLVLPRTAVFDLIDTRALLERSSVKDGRIVFPGGMSYSMLILDPPDPGELTASVASHIDRLRAAGAVVAAAGDVPRSLASFTPDFSAPAPFFAVRRRTENEDIYFVTGEGECEGVFRTEMGDAELWDPVTGIRRRTPVGRTGDGRAAVRLKLPRDGSVFAVFRRKSPLGFEKRREARRCVNLSGPWNASFVYHEGVDAPPPPMRILPLGDFSRHEDREVAHFSGTVSYGCTVGLDGGESAPATLSLGNVVGGLARVFVNGTDIGVAWTAPWELKIPPKILRRGENRFDVRFVNSWANRLIGDCALAPEQRVTVSNLAYRKGTRENGIPPECSGYVAEEKLFPNGLVGPVELRFEDESRTVRDIPYDPSIGRYGLGDLYLPDAVSEDTPVVLAIHGGGWSGGDRCSWSGVADFFRTDLNCAVFNIEYRLAGGANRWPACGDDCLRAARWLLSGEFTKVSGIKAEKIWICGGSAGGHLALWTAMSLPPETVAGAIAISPVGDPRVDFADHPQRYDRLFGAGAETKLPEMDPCRLVDARKSPVLITHAKEDRVVRVESSRAFADACRRAGVRCETYEYGFDAEPNKGGHAIWRPDIRPHRLLRHIEKRIAQFLLKSSTRHFSTPEKPK